MTLDGLWLPPWVLARRDDAPDLDLSPFVSAGQELGLEASTGYSRYDPAKVAPPTILAYEVPAAVRKLYLEVLRLIGAANSGDAPADWVDVPALLDQLGVPLRTAPVEKAEGDGLPGRPPDLTSGQQERREDARTDEAASAEANHAS